MSTQLLCFDLDTETYAVDLARVREIAPFVDVARVPATPAFVRGLLPRQEHPVPVVDLAVKFGLAQTPGSDRLSVVVVDACMDGEVVAPMGILVDASSRVVEIDEREIEAVPELGARIRVEFLRGVAHVEGGLVFVVDLDRMLSATEAEAVHGLAAEHAAELEGHAKAGGAFSDLRAAGAGDRPRVADDREEYVVFLASGERLALGLTQVRELLQYSTVTPVPGAREWIRGVMNRRGQVTPVIDLAKCLGLAPAPVTARSCILVLDAEIEGNRVAVGIAIDDVLDVVSFTRQAIATVPPLGVPVARERLSGVVRIGEAFVALLDVERLLPLGTPSVAPV
jgi:purine-binding chemotaxis protein CheW